MNNFFDLETKAKKLPTNQGQIKNWDQTMPPSMRARLLSRSFIYIRHGFKVLTQSPIQTTPEYFSVCVVGFSDHCSDGEKIGFCNLRLESTKKPADN